MCGGGGSAVYEGGDIDMLCRGEPAECEGDIGGACDVTDDCSDGVCCHDKNCGSGMCLYRCDGDADCPDEMKCEHDQCFFRCQDDSDCGPGQKCEHGGTICEYEGGD
jgi:hypothetical protein